MIEFASFLLVSPDVGVDRLVTDRELAGATQASGDLLGAPVLFQLLLNECEIGLREALISSRPRAPSIRSLDGLTGSVTAIETSAVSLDFSRYGAAVSTQVSSNLRGAKSFPPQCPDGIPFL